MANWNNPQLTSTYTNFLAEVKARDDDIAVQFSTGTISNQPDGAIKWDSSANIWKKWSASGSSWGALTGTYAFPAITATTGGFSSNVTITGTLDASSTISGASFIPDGSTAPANGMFLPSSNTLGFSVSGGQKASLNATGLKLGTGTASCKLEVDGGIKVAGGTTHGSHGYSFRTNDTDAGMFSPANNELTFLTNGSRRLTLEGDKVGINIDNPLTHLHLKGGGSSETTFRIENSEGSFNLKADGDKAYYYADEHIFSSQQGSGNWATLNGTGLGINVTPSSYKLDVTGNTRVTGNLTVTGNITGVVSGTAVNCTNVDIATDTATNADHYVNFTNTQSGIQRIQTDSTLKYNPYTNTLKVTNLEISGSGGGVVPVGGIIIWSGAQNAIPTGWALCDGSSGRPDLRNRFVIGAGSSYSVGSTGGFSDAINISHTHTTNSTGSHAHGVSDPGHLHSYLRTTNFASGGGDASNRRAPFQETSTNTAGNYTGISISSGGSHSHNVNSSGSSGTGRNLPPYYALCYIIKLS
tara:strand:+ start:1239 stop:2816 length:1578 start_codon:yes stop_codon:yes gene_type:complete